MHRASLTACVAALVGVCAVGAPAASASAAADPPATTSLADSVAAVAAGNRGVGAVSGAERRTVEVWMAGRQRAAQRFVDAVSTPGSPSYRRFLSPVAYTQRFGPSGAQVGAVRSFLTGAGFTGVHASVGDDYVSATAPVSTIDRAFAVQMRRYEVAGPAGNATMIQSNDRALTVPASISKDILAVTGLNSSRPQADEPDEAAAVGARAKKAQKSPVCSTYWAQKTKAFTPAFHGLTRAAVPVCGYSARQMRAAYGLTSADTGKGTTIAVIQVGGPDRMFQTLTEYAKRNGLPAPRRNQYREQTVGQGDHNRACENQPLVQEAPMDSEAIYAMAPGADQLMVDGDDCLGEKDVAQALFDAELAPLTGHGSGASAAIESVSYELPGGERGVSPAHQKAGHAVAQRAAAEGVSVLYGSGDDPGVGSPSSDPDVTAVGGTTLGIGARNQRLFETGWSTDLGERIGQSGRWHDTGIGGAAGGGVSAVYGQPSYQKGVVPAALSRNSEGHAGRAVPDISANADHASGMLLGSIFPAGGKTVPYTPFVGSGTSQSTPLVAGIVADAEQGGRKRLGFLNPLLYSLSGSRAYHDIVPPRPSAPQVDRAFYTTGPVAIGHKFAIGIRVGVNDAQDRHGTHQVTAPGYDTTTGLGSPNGPAFINGLRSGKTQPTR
jgi:subtilase family serine protease